MSNVFKDYPADSNEKAVEALVATLGGAAGMIEKGIKLGDLAAVLNADDDDDLSGLRLFAERMSGGWNGNSQPNVTEHDVTIWPDEARQWLVDTGRAQLDDSGQLELKKEDADHLGMAAHLIAKSTDPRPIYDAYSEVTNNRVPLSRSMINEIGNRMIEAYVSED